MLRKILLGFLTLLVLLVAGVAMMLSYTAGCPSEPATIVDGETMSAAIYRCYGGPEVIEVATVEKPAPADNEVLVKVASAGVNPMDWHYMRGSPYIMRLFAGIGAPKDHRMGVDFAGTVEAVGSAVTDFSVGDRVFGGRSGAFAEYVTVRQDRAIAHLPEGVSFKEAGGVAIAGITALQALRDHGNLQAGQRVLINGASGGVGTFAVQIAKSMGAHVTGICSGRNIEMVKSLGADEVFNYREEDYTESGQSFDLVVDMVGNHTPRENLKVLTPEGRLVIVGGAKGDWIGPLIGPIRAAITDPFVSQELKSFTARMSREDLAELAKLMASGELRTVIDVQYPLTETAEALRYSESGRARGKILLAAP
jgi:NADPH:quinone reductase-like Zn-dependent oxidoreductase